MIPVPYFAFYRRTVQGASNGRFEVTKKERSNFLRRGSRRLLANFVHLPDRGTGMSAGRVVPALVYPGLAECHDGGILVECPALNPLSERVRARARFRRMAHVPPHGNYEIRDTGHVLPVRRHAGSHLVLPLVLPSAPSKRCPRAGRLAKVRMMYRAATIMVSLAGFSLPRSSSLFIFQRA